VRPNVALGGCEVVRGMVLHHNDKLNENAARDLKI
jgi:hypothetical protein